MESAVTMSRDQTETSRFKIGKEGENMVEEGEAIRLDGPIDKPPIRELRNYYDFNLCIIKL